MLKRSAGAKAPRASATRTSATLARTVRAADGRVPSGADVGHERTAMLDLPVLPPVTRGTRAGTPALGRGNAVASTAGAVARAAATAAATAVAVTSVAVGEQAAAAAFADDVAAMLQALNAESTRVAAARVIMGTPSLASALVDSDGVRLAHRAVALDPASAVAAVRDPSIAGLSDHRGASVAHAAVGFQVCAAEYVVGLGGSVARMVDGTGWSVAHAAMAHLSCALMVVGMPALAAARDRTGWSVLHEAVLYHPAVAASVLASPLALLTDEHGRSVAEMAVVTHESAALVMQRGQDVHPDVLGLPSSRGMPLAQVASVMFPFASDDARRADAARRSRPAMKR